MVFGQLTIKWRIFCSNLEVSINKASTIVHVASHLHNFVINEDKLFVSAALYVHRFIDVNMTTAAPTNLGYLPIPPPTVGAKSY
jgi:hypothetical protein